MSSGALGHVEAERDELGSTWADGRWTRKSGKAVRTARSAECDRRTSKYCTDAQGFVIKICELIKVAEA